MSDATANGSAPLAYVLWVLVVAALAYGIIKTGDTALALFGA